MSSCAPQESLLQRTNDTTAVQQTDAWFKDSTLIHPLTFLICIWNCPEILKTLLSARYGLHSSYFESMRPFQIKVVRARAVLGPLMDTGVRLLLWQRWHQYVIPLTAPAVLHLLLPVQRGELWVVSRLGGSSCRRKRKESGRRWEWCCSSGQTGLCLHYSGNTGFLSHPLLLFIEHWALIYWHFENILTLQTILPSCRENNPNSAHKSVSRLFSIKYSTIDTLLYYFCPIMPVILHWHLLPLTTDILFSSSGNGRGLTCKKISCPRF